MKYLFNLIIAIPLLIIVALCVVISLLGMTLELLGKSIKDNSDNIIERVNKL